MAKDPGQSEATGEGDEALLKEIRGLRTEVRSLRDDLDHLAINGPGWHVWRKLGGLVFWRVAWAIILAPIIAFLVVFIIGLLLSLWGSGAFVGFWDAVTGSTP